MQDLVGVGVADPAERMRVRERALERVVFRREPRLKLVERRPESLRDRPGPARAEQLLRERPRATRDVLVPASVSRSVPPAEVESRERPFAGEFGPPGFQCRRPAIMRWRMSQRSSSSPIAIRLPRRRISRTFFALDRG